MLRIAALLLSALLAGCAAPYDHLSPQDQNQRDISDARGAFLRGYKLDAVSELARVARRPGGDATLRALFSSDPELKSQVIDAATIVSLRTLGPYWLLNRLGEFWTVSDAALPEIRPELHRVEAEALQAMRAGAFDFEAILETSQLRAFSDPNMKFDVLVDALLNARGPTPALARETVRTEGLDPSHPAKRRLAERFSDREWTLAELNALEPLGIEAVDVALGRSRAPVGPEYGPFVKRSLDAIARDLKDPFSVRYRDVFLSKSPRGDIICGELNAKNSYGAYSGFKRFYSNGTTKSLDDSEKGRDVFNAAWRDLCVHQAGVVQAPS